MEGDNEVFLGDVVNEHEGCFKKYFNRRKQNCWQSTMQPKADEQVLTDLCLAPGWSKDQNPNHVREILQEINNSSTDLGHLTAEEVESILSFVAQDGKPDKNDQQVPTMSRLKKNDLEENRPKRLTYAQKLRRLQNPVDFEAEFSASLKDTLKKTKRRKMRPRVTRTPSVITNDLLFAMENQGIASPGLDLAVAMGIPEDDLAKDKTAARRHTIRAKLKRSRNIQFSLAEEYDIHTRAETHACKLTPDRDFCYLQWECNLEEFAVPEFQPERPRSSVRMGPKRTRKRKSRTGDFYVVQPFGKMHVEPNDEIILPQGLCLVRPPNKLVELVAQAINSSPDGLLQVQQVYHVLQNKYPYYRYMDKSSLTSWRSSIRHALYQKWFRKACFQSEFINCRGCYWAINRKHHPREWTLPAVSQFQLMNPQEQDEGSMLEDFQQCVATPVPNSLASYVLHCSQEACTNPGHASCSVAMGLLPLPATRSSLHLPTIRDPDPMFAPQIPLVTSATRDALFDALEFPPYQPGSSEGSSDRTCSDFSDGSGVDAPWGTWWEESIQQTYSVSSPPPAAMPSFSLTLPILHGSSTPTMDVNVHWSPLKLQGSENLLQDTPQQNMFQEDVIMY